MSDVHPCSSNQVLSRKLKRLVPAFGAMMLVGACSGNGLKDLDFANSVTTAKVQPTAMTSFINRQLDKPSSAKTAALNVSAKPRTTIPANVAAHRTAHGKLVSPWCKYLMRDAAADATILRAPTISGEINDDGRKNATLGYDLVDIARAELTERAARVKCQRHIAQSALTRASIVAPNNLTRAGHREKARIIFANRHRLVAIKALAARELRAGSLDQAQSARLALAVDRLLSDGQSARSEAEKRKGLVAFDLENISELASRLLKAERDLADIKSTMRSADAVSVNLEGGWREGFVQNGVKVQSSSLYGGVKVSMKLGAFNPLRFRHERAAIKARLRAHSTEPGSVFWRLREVTAAHVRARTGLVASARQLRIGLTKAQALLRATPRHDSAYIVQRQGTQVDIIRLEADLAAARASIRQLDHNLARLRQLTTHAR